MARVEVRQLRYKGEPAAGARVEFAVADALRTEVVDDGRLVLVRSFQLGRIGLAERGATRAAASAWRTIRDGARHGGASGAESANCVWFADEAEAHTLLLREMASGRTPFAWFWVLAVPDWRRETLPQWLGRRLDEALRDASGAAIAALVSETTAAGSVEPLATAILARLPATSVGELPAFSGEGEVAKERGEPATPTSRKAQPVADFADLAVAVAIARSIPGPLKSILATVAARSEFAPFVHTLVRGLVRRAHPALALAPAKFLAIAAAVEDTLRFGERHVREEQESSRATSNETATSPHAGERSVASPATEDASPPVETGSTEEGAGSVGVSHVEQFPATYDLLPVELPSSAAGLFLAIVPLTRLGWREWLTERPHLLLHHPGARLLHRIAEHYRVPATDALWGQLPSVDPEDDLPPELEQALDLWRAGLDGWLRRKARLRLAELVLRRGWILPGVETTLVRLPLQAIEIRLRRLALDGDPGWIDWLGHSYRLVYRDRPLLGHEA